MNQFDACKILGLNGKITSKHVVSAYTKLALDSFISKQSMREVNAAYSVMQNFHGGISNKTRIK